jgi:DNA-binding GntR family transcriptional regulator
MTEAKSAMPEFSRVDKDTLHERVYGELRTALMTGRFLPGQSVTIRALADAFGTSAMPVREALRRLVAEQALEILPNRSVIVPRMTRERLEDLRRVRAAIEGMAAEQAAAHITADELDKLQALLEQMRVKVKQGGTHGYLSQNQDFHFTIYAAARSAVLLPIIESLWLQIGPVLTVISADPKLSAIFAEKHHTKALAALRAGDGAGAREAIAGDISEAADYLLELADLAVEKEKPGETTLAGG